MNPGKASLRALVRERVRRLSPEARRDASAAIVRRVIALPAWTEARSVLLFWPLPDEPDVAGLVAESGRTGKRLTLPAYDPASAGYQPRLVREPATELVSGRFGVREPSPSCPAMPVETLDLIVLPGVAFSPDGSRLGRGKGYYDRLLAVSRAVTCGVGFDEQLVPLVPVEPHDVKLHYVVTPSRLLDCRDGGG